MGKPTRFQRKQATRDYRKVFYLFTEGYKTEPLYFSMLQEICPEHIHLKIKPHETKSDVLHVLKRAKHFIRNEKPRVENSEFWLIVDVDDRTPKQFDKLKQWSKEKNNYCLAISNPCFEYWLLLHFEKGDAVYNLKDRLKKHMPNYEKHTIDEKILLPKIITAIKNAKEKHRQSSNDCFAGNCSTVYILVEKIIKQK